MLIDLAYQTFEDKEKTTFTHSAHISCLNFPGTCLSNVSSQRVITETTGKLNLKGKFEPKL